jgi:hypothetical protein
MMIAFSGMMKIVIELQKVGLVVTRCKTITEIVSHIINISFLRMRM